MQTNQLTRGILGNLQSKHVNWQQRMWQNKPHTDLRSYDHGEAGALNDGHFFTEVTEWTKNSDFNQLVS